MDGLWTPPAHTLFVVSNEWKDRFIAAVVGAAPLLGVPVWVACIAAVQMRPHADYDDLPFVWTSGLFMAAAGLLVAAIFRLTTRSAFVRAMALESLRFHVWVGAACVVVAATFLLSFGDPANPTMANPPRGFMAAVTICILAYGIVLPLVELGRALLAGFGAATKTHHIS
ncbi:MAG: hypothetical protein JO277_02245 [Candidatus Eremiobacteraeota bacterium]|nr:hypothetical protein [Candidatus Eremiobacteraeota bacterium]